MDQVWKGLSNLDPRDPGGFYKKPLCRPNILSAPKIYYCPFHVWYLLNEHSILNKILKYDLLCTHLYCCLTFHVSYNLGVIYCRALVKKFPRCLFNSVEILNCNQGLRFIPWHPNSSYWGRTLRGMHINQFRQFWFKKKNSVWALPISNKFNTL